jgi:hypothetical protein
MITDFRHVPTNPSNNRASCGEAIADLEIYRTFDA